MRSGCYPGFHLSELYLSLRGFLSILFVFRRPVDGFFQNIQIVVVNVTFLRKRFNSGLCFNANSAYLAFSLSS